MNRWDGSMVVERVIAGKKRTTPPRTVGLPILQTIPGRESKPNAYRNQGMRSIIWKHKLGKEEVAEERSSAMMDGHSFSLSPSLRNSLRLQHNLKLCNYKILMTNMENDRNRLEGGATPYRPHPSRTATFS
ncbi:hypothetical protein J6590_061866 [Homalodisca vitripennis]|nr:hypothetical protein J6590_061866 [Homalodisca vitripennis]